MVFSSFIFILMFLPVTLIGYYLLSRLKNGIYQRLFLILASLFFYGWYNISYLLLIIVSIAVNYALAVCMQHTLEKGGCAKTLLVLGVLFNIGLIGYFKYYDFFIENLNLIAGTDFVLRNIILPLGISFFTFQQLSFLVSIYHREEEVERLQDYVLFVIFFPQLVAGPIVLYSEMILQFKDETRRFFNSDSFAAGIYMFTIGLFKKAVIADTLAVFADNGFGMTGLGLAAAWVTSLSYTMQIYFDFSGYSDMAVGLGRMFNIELPFNFLSPYQSESITEFWRRWHITLGRALSAYVYKPLGGNRKGLPRTCLNLFVTFLVSGLWHGAAWTFVLWGGLHGVFVVGERIFKNSLQKIPKAIRVGVTFLIVNFLWVLFRADGLGQALEIYRGMFNFGYLGLELVRHVAGTTFDVLILLMLTIVIPLIIFKGKNSANMLIDFRVSKRTLIFAAVLFSVAMLCLSREAVFIYYNF